MTPPPSRLSRQLGVRDAVVVGLGSMIGAGIFAALGPAADVAGSALLVGLAIAGIVAYCNATSSAALAAVHPSSGGTYVYGRARLSPFWGYLAGWGFVVGKTASCAAMALTLGAYAAPAWERPIAVAAVVVLTAVNYFGVRKTVAVTGVLVFLVLVALAVVVATALASGDVDPSRLEGTGDVGPFGILRSAGLLFFAFAGYARIATLGEEVVDPARTIPKAIPRALGITLVVYAVVATTSLLAVGPGALASSEAPLATVAGAGGAAGGWAAGVVRAGGAIAALGVLLSLIAGVSRTTFAMAADRELPHWLAAVHPVHSVPHRADVVIGATIVTVVALTDLRGAIGFSSFCVLGYYAITNAAALTLPPEHRRWPRPLQAAGLLGCVVLAFTLPAASIVAGAAVLAAGAVVRQVRRLTA
ncbi:MAG TPA: APC family permease [Acidimicrobiales bacterium]|nr:APC family permease [Acidimicrobiales bacterium]